LLKIQAGEDNAAAVEGEDNAVEAHRRVLR
jgi:hypothetical protein